MSENNEKKETKVHSQYQEAVEKQPKVDSQCQNPLDHGGPGRPGEGHRGPWRGGGPREASKLPENKEMNKMKKKRKKKKRGTDAPSGDEGPAPLQGSPKFQNFENFK